MRRFLAVLTALVILFPGLSLTGPARAGSSSPIGSRATDQAGPQIMLEPVLADLDQPLFVTGARDGSHRLFVVERPGRIKVLAPGASQPTPFLDITERVGVGGERGMLGLAFHPQYAINGRFFVSYSRLDDGATVIGEYHVSQTDANIAETDEQPLIVIPQPSDIHHSGMLEFSKDGLLYISVGDGNQGDPEGAAQNLDSLRGKILRIDVDHKDGDNLYSSPSDNPFYGDTPGRDEIYALGFRNPWRFSIDGETGQLYVGDVGETEREEVDVVTIGGNYGWRVFEGTRCTNYDPDACATLLSVAPLLEYEHTEARCAITGGYVYRGGAAALPAGAYVFADFCTGEIFLWNEGGVQRLLDSERNIASFGEDDNGELYVVGLGGTVERIASAIPAAPLLQITSVQIRKRANGVVLDPVTIRSKSKKFDAIVRGTGFETGAMIVINGRTLPTDTGATPDKELSAKLRGDLLGQPGRLVFEVVNPDGSRSNPFAVQVLDE